MTYSDDFTLYSRFLRQTRRITVFSPSHTGPTASDAFLFCVDGQSIRTFADCLTDSGETPRVALIGAHSNKFTREQECLPGVNTERFDAHESFFTTELYNWAKAEFGIQPSRERCGIFGYSNGGTFAVMVGGRHADKFGVVIGFSIASGPSRSLVSVIGQTKSRYYLAAGTREEGFRRTTAAVADVLAHHGISHEYRERVAGHEFGFWRSELPKAIEWSFAVE